MPISDETKMKAYKFNFTVTVITKTGKKMHEVHSKMLQ